MSRKIFNNEEQDALNFLQDKKNNLRRKQNCDSMINSAIQSFNGLVNQQNEAPNFKIFKVVRRNF